MPKIRGIRPEFWTDEDIVELSMPARLLFIGMWNFACDNGHLDDKPRQVKMRVLPADDVDADDLLTELESQGRITRDGQTITILNFAKHQKPHRRWWQTCDLPLCEVPEDAPQQGRNGGATVDHGETTDGQRAFGDGDGDGDGELKVKDARASKPRKRRIPDHFAPNDNHRAFAAENRIDLDHELARFIGHAQANGRTLVDWNAGFRNWLASEFTRKLPEPTNVRHLPHASQLEEPPNGLSDAELEAWYRGRR